MNKRHIHTEHAPKAIGTYSQAIKNGEWLFLSGQIPLDPHTMQLVGDDFVVQTHQVFKNLLAVLQAAGGEVADVVKLTVYLVDLNQFVLFNEVMAQYFSEPYPARAVVQVAALPKAAKVEVEGIAVVN